MMRNQRGFSLIEVLLSLALGGILSVAIPGALSTANKTTIISNEHGIAESLARSQMDYIQNQTYNGTSDPPVYILLSDLPSGYSIDTLTARLDPKGDGVANDDGLQQITVTIKHGTKAVYTLINFKVNFEQ